MFRWLLRPICWIFGHAPWIEEIWEMLPMGIVVCSRCNKMAPCDVQRQYVSWMLTNLVEDDTGIRAEFKYNRAIE